MNACLRKLESRSPFIAFMVSRLQRNFDPREAAVGAELSNSKADTSVGKRSDTYRIDRPEPRPFMVVTRCPTNFFRQIRLLKEFSEDSIVERAVHFLDEDLIPQRMKLLNRVRAIVKQIATSIIRFAKRTLRFNIESRSTRFRETVESCAAMKRLVNITHEVNQQA